MSIISKFTGLFGNKKTWSPDWLASAGINPGVNSEIVTAENCQQLTALNRCVSLLSESLASSRLILTQSLPSGGKQLHSAGRLSLWQYVDIEAGLVDALISGNGYWRKSNLESIPAWRVSIEVFDNGTVEYVLQADASLSLPEERLSESEILHLRFRTGNAKHNLLGVSPVANARPALNTILVQNQAHSTIYQNVSMPLMTLSTQKPLNREQAKRIAESWRTGLGGKNLGKVPVLDNGLEAQQLDIPSALDFALDTISTLSVKEVGRLYGVPVQLLNESSDISFGSAVELSRSFVSLGLKPWANRFSDMLTHSMLGRDRLLNGYRVEVDLSDALLGHGSERADYLSKMVNGGIISVNEARNMGGMPDVDGGNTLRAPVNVMPLDSWQDYNPGGTDEPAVEDKQFRIVGKT